MTIADIKQAIATGFADVSEVFMFVQAAVPSLEASIPAVGAETPEISAALEAAKGTQGVIADLLTREGISQETHDALRARVSAVIAAVPYVTTPAVPTPETVTQTPPTP